MKKRVLVIGAGAAGLIAIKEFGSFPDVFDVVCMESLSVVGGLWNYSEVITDPNHPTGSDYTAVYKNLRTNLPRQIMNFSDIPFPENIPTFVHHSDVKEYLWNYSKAHSLEKFIRFNTKVTSVKPKRQLGREDVWQVESVDVNNKKTSTAEFDIVIVCNGHFFEATYPKTIKGLDTFQGKILHSQHYRDREDFRGKRVLLIGAGPSGLDIVSEICVTATKTWLSQRLPVALTVPEVVEQVGEVVELVGRDAIISTQCHSTRDYSALFKLNKSALPKSTAQRVCGIDVILFCTGFSFSLPFLSADCGVSVVSSEGLSPLLKDMICPSRQSLAFVGVQNRIIPFNMFEQQVKFLRLFYQGSIDLPKHGKELVEMMRKDDEVKKSYGVDVDSNRYQLSQYQWPYLDHLAELGGFEKIPRRIERLYRDLVVERSKSLFGYKETEYQMGPDGFYVRCK